MQTANPKFNVGEEVLYTDRHGRLQTGKVYNIEAKWNCWSHRDESKPPYIHYTLQHPTYRNGQFHTNEDSIIRSVGGE
jgi:hypothetical protein